MLKATIINRQDNVHAVKVQGKFCQGPAEMKFRKSQREWHNLCLIFIADEI